MFMYSAKSQNRLNQAHPDLIMIAEVLMGMQLLNVGVVYTHRDEVTQNKLFEAVPQVTTVKFPNSKHNAFPSNAIDFQIYINGKPTWERVHYIYLAGIVMAIAYDLKKKVRWGGNWDMDSEIMTDQKFQDLMHFERVEI